MVTITLSPATLKLIEQRKGPFSRGVYLDRLMERTNTTTCIECDMFQPERCVVHAWQERRRVSKVSPRR